MTTAIRRLRWMGLAFSTLILVGIGCGSSEGSGGGSASSGKGGGGGNGGGENPPSCKTLCAHLQSICGMAPPSCDALCEGATAQEKGCIADAPTCSAANACGSGSSNGGASGGSGGSGGSAGGGNGGSSSGVACDPYRQLTDANMTCAQGCDTADAEDQQSIWCLKHCQTDDDCSCSGSDCGAVSKCVEGAELGNPKVCAPGCFNDSDCESHGWGKCQTLTGYYCDGGPHTNEH